MTVNRITLFKISNDTDRARLLDLYRSMQQKALKNGEPYILGVKAGTAFPNPRDQGFDFAVQSTFASPEDMAYYDNECSAHAELKSFVKTVHSGAMMVYFEDELE